MLNQLQFGTLINSMSNKKCATIVHELSSDQWDQLLSVIQSNPNLEELIVISSPIDVNTAEKLGKTLALCTKLKTLYFINMPLKNLTIELVFKDIKNNPESVLEYIGFSTNSLDANEIDSVVTLINLPKLKEFEISNNPIGDTGIAKIANAFNEHTSLEMLGLINTNVTSTGLHVLTEAIKNNKKLNKLYLSRNQIGDVGADCLAEMLAINSSLTFLSIKNCVVTAIGAAKIAAVLKEQNDTLAELNFSDNPLQDAGAEAIADALNVNTGLCSLQMTNVGITADGCQKICAAMKANKGIVELTLQDAIGDLGAEKISDMLKENNMLEVLSIINCGIGNIGMSKIAEALESNSSLIKLMALTNPFDVLGTVSLFKALQQNRSLQCLDLGGVNVTDACAEDLILMILSNNVLTTLNVGGNLLSKAAKNRFAVAMSLNTALVNSSLNDTQDENYNLTIVDILSKKPFASVALRNQIHQTLTKKRKAAAIAIENETFAEEFSEVKLKCPSLQEICKACVTELLEQKILTFFHTKAILPWSLHQLLFDRYNELNHQNVNFKPLPRLQLKLFKEVTNDDKIEDIKPEWKLKIVR